MSATYGETYQPAARAPRRRRRWPYVLVVILLIIAGLLVVADRVAVGVSQDKIADRLSNRHPFADRPKVTIHGFPFLTQAVAGHYDDIEAKGNGVAIGKLSPIAVDAHLHGVDLSLADAARHVDQVPVDHAEFDFTASLDALAAASGIDGLRLTAAGDQITATGPVTLDSLGSVTVSATGKLVTDGDGNVAVDLTDLKGVGVSLPASAEPAARAALGLVVPVTDLPFNAEVRSVRVVNGAVQLVATADHLILE